MLRKLAFSVTDKGGAPDTHPNFFSIYTSITNVPKVTLVAFENIIVPTKIFSGSATETK